MTGDRHYIIPPGTPMRSCRGKNCGARIFFVSTAHGKKLPVNVDGTPHFSTCPDADNFRRKRNYEK